MEYAWIVWLGFVVVAVILEAATSALVTIWFIPGAVIALVLSVLNVPLWVQIVVFAVLSVVLLLFTRKIVKKLIDKKTQPTNLDAIIGQSAVVTERICNINQTGAVKVMGKEWTARSEDGEDIEVGAVVTVKEISGVKLICK